MSAAVSVLWELLATGLVHGTALAAVTAVLAFTVLRRARPALVVALWTVVLIKFVAPVGPALPVSFDSALAALRGDAAPSMEAPVAAVAPGPASAVAAASTADPLRTALLAGYLAIVLALVVRRVRASVTARRSARALPLASDAVNALVARAAAGLGMRRAPETRVAGGSTSPHVTGLRSPVLVVPAALAAQPRELEAVVLHELAHLRRRDTYLRALQVTVGVLFFFWPVVALINRRIDRAREMACDQWAVSRGPLERRAYARLLVRLARARVVATPGAALAFVHPRLLEARVDALLAGHARPRLGKATGALVAAWSVMSLAGAASAGEAQPGQIECVVGPGIVQAILAEYPEADVDGDGDLSTDEVCAHQRRLKRKAVDGVFDTLGTGVTSWLDPAVDIDGNGELSAAELERVKDQLAVSLPAEVLGVEVVTACEADTGELAEPSVCEAAR